MTQETSVVDATFMGRALELAREAADQGEVPVAALVVADGKVLGSGTNTTKSHADPTGHAEIVALREAARRAGAARLPPCTLYATLEPCLMCLGAMIHARVTRLVYGASDPKVGASGLLAEIPVGFAGLNHRIDVVGGVEAEACAKLLREFFRARR